MMSGSAAFRRQYRFCTNVMMSASPTVRMTIWVLYQHYVWFCNGQNDDGGFVPTSLWSASAALRMTVQVLYQHYDVCFSNVQNEFGNVVAT